MNGFEPFYNIVFQLIQDLWKNRSPLSPFGMILVSSHSFFYRQQLENIILFACFFAVVEFFLDWWCSHLSCRLHQRLLEFLS